LSENARLQEQVDKYQREVESLQKLSNAHENKIESLLKFNEKLQHIIEKEITCFRLRSSGLSLQPISERTEIESEGSQSQLEMMSGQTEKLGFRKTLDFKDHPLCKGGNWIDLAAVDK
jgi:hypothetical protein